MISPTAYAGNNASFQQLGQQAGIKVSRLSVDVERIVSLAKRVDLARDRLNQHTATLGYFESTSTGAAVLGAKVQPVADNLQTALADLESSIETLRSALDVLD